MEIISDLAAMVRELLIQFYRSTRFKPTRIFMFRDGVSEGQFTNVLQYELRAMREACMTLEHGYQPGITFIAVQKRHHTRLFAVDKKDQVSSNVLYFTNEFPQIRWAKRSTFHLAQQSMLALLIRPISTSTYARMRAFRCISRIKIMLL